MKFFKGLIIAVTISIFIWCMIFSCVFGQVPILPIGMNEPTQDEFAKHVDRVYAKMNYDNLQITRGMILDYAEECYNDSTISGYIIYTDFYSDYTEDIDAWHKKYDGMVEIVKTDTIYSHKEPTFEGFIEWLRSK